MTGFCTGTGQRLCQAVPDGRWAFGSDSAQQVAIRGTTSRTVPRQATSRPAPVRAWTSSEGLILSF